ncbi:5948_t:CDS:2 [Scutellospora calospora]|uniref:5948_t:CDS:1 n=1 Tax=Scutellospora calospora TaxID=85575 RepID=A0ACA9JWA0_9GLOM|nr:5948_t:CDS:2 [Scutellospora calospora]
MLLFNVGGGYKRIIIRGIKAKNINKIHVESIISILIRRLGRNWGKKLVIICQDDAIIKNEARIEFKNSEIGAAAGSIVGGGLGLVIGSVGGSLGSSFDNRINYILKPQHRYFEWGRMKYETENCLTIYPNQISVKAIQGRDDSSSGVQGYFTYDVLDENIDR